jgi:hypothetical protein
LVGLGLIVRLVFQRLSQSHPSSGPGDASPVGRFALPVEPASASVLSHLVLAHRLMDGVNPLSSMSLEPFDISPSGSPLTLLAR